jgi:DNA invertase Pin-like site-specific DNA recombinase
MRLAIVAVRTQTRWFVYSPNMTSGAEVIGYARVSTEQQGESRVGLEAQRAAIEAECERRGWQLVGLEHDVQSGQSTNGRDGLQRALEAARAGDVSGVVAAKLDRLTRSLLDFAGLVQDAQRHGYNLVVVDQAFDLATPHGRAMAGMLAVFAEYERELISERVKRALAVVKARGPAPGKKPIGRPAVMDPKVRARIRRMRRTGKSLGAIAERLNADAVPTAHGGQRWHASTVRRALETA